MKLKNENPIVIVCAANNKYTIFLAAMIKSLIINHKSREKIDLYVLDDRIKKSNKKKILKSTKSEKIKIKWVKINRHFDNLKAPYNYKLPINYYRLLIPYMLPKEINKAIYLDCDIIILEDISKLWNKDSKDKIILAVQDAGKHTINWREGILNYKELGINPKSKYFNSGVLVINLKKWRDENISKKVIDCSIENKKYLIHYDQYGLNVVLAGRWKELDPRWNQSPYISLNKKPFIVHYVTDNKPLSRNYQENFKDLFFDYVDMTKFKGWRPSEEWIAIKLLRKLKRRIFNGEKI